MEQKEQHIRLKQNELLIKKQFQEAVKTQERQYKALKEHLLSSTPKPEQKAILKKLKEDQTRKLAFLAEQYAQHVADVFEQHALQSLGLHVDETQVAEAQGRIKVTRAPGCSSNGGPFVKINTSHGLMLLRHHESTQDLEWKDLAALQKFRLEHMKKQQETELANQKLYNSRAEQDLGKKHIMEQKQQPRSKLKQKELSLMFYEAITTQERQYKTLKKHLLLSTPKPEQKAVVKKLKEDQTRKLAFLAEQYAQSVADMLEQESVRLDETQDAEANELKQRLQQELELLTAYQSKIKMQTEAHHVREREQLEERVSLRIALLEQKMDEESATYQVERS